MLRGFGLDAINQVDTKVQVDGFVTHDVLKLFTDTGHAVLTMELKIITKPL